MKKIYALIMAAAAVATVSCSKASSEIVPEEPGNIEAPASQHLLNPVTITFQADPSTKLSINEGEDNGTPTWDDDKIQICSFDAEGVAKYVVSEAMDPATGTFTATVEDSDVYYAAYPSDLKVELSKDGEDNDRLIVSHPDGNDGKFDAPTSYSQAARFVAKTTKAGKHFSFKSISTIIKFTVEDAEAEQVYFRSTGNLSYVTGYIPITFDGDDVPVLTDPGEGNRQGNVTVNVTGAGDYYLPLPATKETTASDSYGNGFILQIRKSGAKVPAAYWNNVIVLNPGQIYVLRTSIDDKAVKNYYVSPGGTGDGLSQETPFSLSDLAGTYGFTKSNMAAAFILDGLTVNLLGDASAYTSAIPVSKGTTAHSYNIVGGVGGGTATITTTSSPTTFNNANATVNISNVTFDGCSGTNGGAVVVGPKGFVNFTACNFTNNTANNGGAVDVAGSAASTDDNLKVSFTDCYFYQNTASSTGGGAVLVASATNGGIVTFNNCLFKGNSSTGNPGAGASLYSLSKAALFFNKCSFYEEKASTYATNPKGYIIHSKNTDGRLGINNCTFRPLKSSSTNNSANDGFQVISIGYGVISNSTLWCGSATTKVAMLTAGRPSCEGVSAADNLIINSFIENRVSGRGSITLYPNNYLKAKNLIHGGFATKDATYAVAEPSSGIHVFEDCFNRNSVTAPTGASHAESTYNGITQEVYTYTFNNTIFSDYAPITRGDIKSAIRSTPVIGDLFCDWLYELGALDVDIRGVARGSSDSDLMSPGAVHIAWSEKE